MAENGANSGKKSQFDLDESIADHVDLFNELERLRGLYLDLAVIASANQGVLMNKLVSYEKAYRGGFGWKSRVRRVVAPAKATEDHLLDAAAEMRRIADEFRRMYIDDLVPKKPKDAFKIRGSED